MLRSRQLVEGHGLVPAAHGQQVHGVVAHSMGCAATGLALAEGLSVERVAFVSPPSNQNSALGGSLAKASIGLAPMA